MARCTAVAAPSWPVTRRRSPSTSWCRQLQRHGSLATACWADSLSAREDASDALPALQLGACNKGRDHRAGWPVVQLQRLWSALHSTLELAVFASRFPGRRHRSGRPLVRALRPQLRRSQRMAGRARRPGRPEHHLSLGAALPAAVRRGGSKVPRACGAGLTRGRDLRSDPLPLALHLSSHR
jgi:hypothetical protein